MIYDAFTLAACVAEMRPALSGLIVHQVRQPEALTVCLACRARGRESQVLLSADARFARAHLSSGRPSVPPTPPGFCQLLRKHLNGARIEDVRQIGLDRILRVDFHSHDGWRGALIHEIMGRHSNIILVDGDNRVLGAAKVVGKSISRARQVLPGHPYQPPPAPKADPRGLSIEQFESLRAGASERDPARWLVSTFAGISPTLAAEIVCRAMSLDAPDLFQSLARIISAFENNDFHPVLLRNPGNGHEEAYPLRLQHLPSDWQHPRPALSDALEATVRGEIARAGLESARSDILKTIQRDRERLAHESDQLVQVLADPSRADELRKKGQILSASFQAIPTGEPAVLLPDLFDPEMKPVSIELAPHLAPQDNVQRYFRLARKAEEAAKAARRRLPEISANIERLDLSLRQAAEADSLEALKAMRAALQTARLIQASPVQSAARREERPFAGHRIRTFTSVDGIEILMGDNAEANDYLTTRVAAPNDIWLHARGGKGAHVVVRSAGVKEMPQATLRQAARMAADNSDARHSSYVPVDWTLRKFVRKPRKSAPGLVTYTHEKTIHVTR